MSHRRLGVGLAALLGLMLPVLTSPVGSWATAVPAGSDSVQRFGSCLAAGGQGDLLLVLDTSGSLQDTDPESQRVEAATYLLQELTSFVGQSGSKLDVAVAGFADTYRQTLGWTALGEDTAGQVLDAVAAYRMANTGFETDYWSALNGARKDLSAHAGEGDCTAMVWLSDGMFDLDNRSTSAEQKAYGTTKPYGPEVDLKTDANADRVQRAGVVDLCRKGGVSDALRVQGVLTLAIGLQGGQQPASFDLMKGIATGADVEGDPCGARDASHTGDFVLAQNIGDLFFAFDELADPDHAPISQTTPMCQGTFCPEGAHQFVLDPSISSVRILGGTDLTDFYAVLQSPDGTRTRITPGGSIRGSPKTYELKGNWVSGSVFSLTLTRERNRGWTGAWQIAFVDPASTGEGSARSNIRLYGDLRPAWLDGDTVAFTSGESAALHLGLARVDGSQVAPEDLRGTVAVDAELRYADGATVPIASGLDAGQLAAPVELDLGAAPVGKAKVHLTLSLTTAPAGSIPGTRLEPQGVDYPVVVAPPPNYPTLPETVNFGSGDSADPVTAVLPLSGAGCAWLESVESTTLPEGVSAASVTADGADANSCRTDQLALALTPDEVGSGLVSGVLHVMTRSDQASAEPTPVTVRYTYEMQRPIIKTVLWLVLVGLMVLGLLIPLLILLAIKLVTPKVPGSTLTTLVASGQVSGSSSFLNGWRPDGAQLQPRSLDATDRRRIVVSPRTVLRARPNLLKLTEAGYVVVENAPFVCSTGARLPLAVQDNWVAVLDSTDPSGPVEVVFLMSSGARRLDQLVSDARVKVPPAVAELRRGLTTPPASSGGNDEWGSPVSSGAGPVAPQTGADQW